MARSTFSTLDKGIIAGDLAKKEIPNWEEAEFEAMAPKVLRMFATYNAKATMKEPWLQQTKDRGFNSADLALARKVWLRQGAKNIAHERPEDYVKQNGGKSLFYPDKIEVVSLSGEKKVRPNSPIPAPFGHKEKYANIVPVSAFCSQLVKNEGGKWITAINEQWMRVFAQSFLSMETIEMLAVKVVQILESDVVWKSYTSTDRSSVSGLSAMTFIRMAIERLDKVTYYVLNTRIVCDGFRTFSRDETGWYQNLIDENEPVVPEALYSMVEDPPEAVRSLLQKDYPGCYLYHGGVLPSPIFPVANGSFESAKLSGQKVREILGGDVSTANLLSGMRDFSGLTDFFGKKVAFYLSACLSCWQKGKKVDIQLESIGDAFILVSSLNYWRTYLNGENSSKNVQFPKIADDAYCLLVPGVSALIPEKLKVYFVESVRSGTVFIMWSDMVLPTAGEKGAKVDYDSASYDILHVRAKQNDYIVHSVIFGSAPFPLDQSVEKKKKTRIKAFVNWEKTPYVYKFSTAVHFRGVISSFPNLSLVGFGYKKLEDGGWDSRGGNQIVFVPLVQILTQKAWYENVVKDGSRQIVSFLCPVIRYSPISNLVSMSKNALIASSTMVEKEEGDQYVATPELVRVPFKRKAIGWGDKVPDKSFLPPSSSKISFEKKEKEVKTDDEIAESFPEGDEGDPDGENDDSSDEDDEEVQDSEEDEAKVKRKKKEKRLASALAKDVIDPKEI